MMIGQTIRQLRLMQGVSQVDLARKGGITLGGLCRLETGKSANPTWSTVERALSGLGMKLVILPIGREKR